MPTNSENINIPEGWIETTLGEVMYPVSETFDLKNTKEVHFLNTGDILDGKLLHTNLSISKGLPGQAKKKFRKGDILYSEIRPENKRYMFVDFDSLNSVASTKLMILRARDNIDSKYLYKYITSDNVIKEFQSTAESRSGTFPQITFDAISNFPILLPEISEQQAISKLLSSFDDKIELLSEQNIILEQIAQTIFQEWFGKYGLDDDLPEGWRVGKLEDVINTIESGTRPKGGINPDLKEGVPSLGAESINGIGIFDFSKTKYVTPDFYNKTTRGNVNSYDILIYKDGAYVGKKGMFGLGFPFEKFLINEHVFILRNNNINTHFWLYLNLKENEIAQLNNSSAQPGLNQESMRKFKIIIPPINIVDMFGTYTKNLFDKIFINCKQIQTLSKTRNELLPKLMNGEIKMA